MVPGAKGVLILGQARVCPTIPPQPPGVQPSSRSKEQRRGCEEVGDVYIQVVLSRELLQVFKLKTFDSYLRMWR
ncbi:unnamed protein product [Calypogeia fissa]